MPKAEVGSTKHLSNKMKSKGLQRLRWYCQICERQMRDENGFKMHVASESHVRQMLVVGENSARFIADFSSQFKRDFLQLLRTSHGEKKINLNHFYQEYIRNKEHVHMNATRWASLTEFGKFLGREGICRVEEGDKGLEVAWIDNSPESLRRQDAIKKKERQDRGDEEREQRLIASQVEKAQREAEEKSKVEPHEDAKLLQRKEGEKLTLSFANKNANPTSTLQPADSTGTEYSADDKGSKDSLSSYQKQSEDITVDGVSYLEQVSNDKPAVNVGLNISSNGKPKNIFAASTKKNPLHGGKSTSKVLTQRPMSEAERIMKEEIQRKRVRTGERYNGSPSKKAKV